MRNETAAGIDPASGKPCTGAQKPDAPKTLGADLEAAWWRAWRECHDLDARAALIHAYLPHARMIAAIYYKRRTHEEIGFDDYLQLASVGLLESIDRYDPGKNVLFKTFCARRLHGAILDGLDALSEKNRQIAVRRALQGERLAALADSAVDDTHSPGQSQSQSQRTHRLVRYLAEIGIGTALGILLEDTGMVENSQRQDDRNMPTDVSYFKKTELQRLRSCLHAALQQLDDGERSVIKAHYLEDVAFGDIADALGLKRARISQLHRQGLQKLRAALGPGHDFI